MSPRRSQRSLIVMRPTNTMTKRPTHLTLNAQAKNIPVRVRKYHHSKEKGLEEEERKPKGSQKDRKEKEV